MARFPSLHRIRCLPRLRRVQMRGSPYSAPVSQRTLFYCLVVAVAVLVVVRLVNQSPTSRPAGTVSASAPASAASGSAAPGPAAVATGSSAQLALRRPTSSIAELGVLTERTESALAAVVDRVSLAQHVTADLCGDPASCEAVRATLNDDSQTTVQVLDASTWSLDRADIDAGARGLSASERARVSTLSRVIVVRVTGPPGPKALALRAAIAASAAIAREVGGVVWDQLLARFENARVFASHAVTVPLEASAFRRDRVEILYEPKAEGIVRVLTAGMSRWGAPDVEAAAVPTPVSPRMAEVVLAVAESIADGAPTQPLLLSLDDLGRARGGAYALDAGFPAPVPVEIEVVMVHPENGDPNDFMARIVPPAGEGPIGYVDLAERFFGPVLAAAPGEDVLRARRARAQAKLEAALGRWEAQKASGAKMRVLLPFPIPGDKGIESMWIEVTRVGARTVTGKLTDEPLGATDVKNGDEVTRPRTQVEDLEVRGGSP